MVRLLVWIVAVFLAGGVGYFVVHLYGVMSMAMDPPFPAWEFQIIFLVPMVDWLILSIVFRLLAYFWVIPFLVFRIAAEVMHWWSFRGAIISGATVSIVGSALITFAPANRWPDLDQIMAEFLIFGVVGIASGAAYYFFENGLWRLGRKLASG